MVANRGNRILILASGMLLALLLTPAASAWTWPVDGPVLRPFVAEDDPYAGGQHRGIDVAAPVGGNVRAPATGVASFAGQLPREGLCLTIRTADGYSITLVHLGSIGVRTGTAIEEGEVVGTIGPSGEAEWAEPYVHLGIRLTADPHGYVDPLSLLPVRSSGQPQPRPVEPPPVVTAPVAQPLRTDLPAVKPRRSATRANRAPRERPRPRTAVVGSSARGAATPAARRAGAEPSARRARPTPVAEATPARSAIATSSASKAVSTRARPHALRDRWAPPATAATLPAVGRPRQGSPKQFLLALLGAFGLALLAVGLVGRRRAKVPISPRSGRSPLRKMSETKPRPEDRLPEPPT